MLDTNICIHLIQRQPLHLIEKLQALKHGDAVLSSIVLAELQHGVERDVAEQPQAQRSLTALLDFFPVLAFDESAARSYGVLRAAAPDRRRNALDRLIAAHALSLGLALVTNNEDDFLGYPGLMVENWVRGA
jgi:tRNA(fMet)-specific endonuclease VapC